MNIKENILDDKLIIEIGKFAVLWNLFEKEHCNNNCNREKIKIACEFIVIDQEKQAKFAQALNKRREWFKQLYLDFINTNLYSDNKKPTDEEIEAIKCFLNQDGKDWTYGCLLCVYRIRNNMMHGLKDIEKLNKQIGIFQAVNEILESI